MPEEELLDILEMVKESVRLVQDRFEHIETPEDFCTSACRGIGENAYKYLILNKAYSPPASLETRRAQRKRTPISAVFCIWIAAEIGGNPNNARPLFGGPEERFTYCVG